MGKFYWSNKTPAAPSGARNVTFQSDGGSPEKRSAHVGPASAETPGVIALEPTGDNKIFLAGDGTWKNLGIAVSGADGKTTPVDADLVGLSDSAASNTLKKLSWANIKATLKSYFDTIYDAAGAAIAAVVAHVALNDPHAQYQKESEKDAAGGYVGLDASGNASVAGRHTAKAFTGGWVVTTPPVDSDTQGLWLPRIPDLNQNLIYDYLDELYYMTRRAAVTLTANGTPVAEANFENIFVDNSFSYTVVSGNSPFPLVLEIDCSSAPIAANGSGYYSLGLTFRSNPQIPTHILLEQWNLTTSAYETAIDVDLTALTYNSVYLSNRFLALASASYGIRKLRLTLSGSNPTTANFYLQRVSLYHATAVYDPWHLGIGGGTLYGAVNMKSVLMLKADGSLGMASLADAAAANSSLFIGSDHGSKVCYKSAAGTVLPHVALDGSALVPTVELGTGAADSNKYLRGDRTWAALSVPPFGDYTKLLKTADQDVTNSSALVDDTELQFAVTAAHRYHVLVYLLNAMNDSAGGYRLAFGVSAGTMNGSGSAIGGTGVDNILASAAANTDAVNVTSGVWNLDAINGAFVTFAFTPSSNGIFSLKFANWNAGAGRISRTCKNSCMYCKDVS